MASSESGSTLSGSAGQGLIITLQWSFADADEFHSTENKAKMSSGQPLTDKDRLPWLLNIHSYIKRVLDLGQSAIVTCSALKKFYRDILLHGETVLSDSRTTTNDSYHQSHDHLVKEQQKTPSKNQVNISNNIIGQVAPSEENDDTVSASKHCFEENRIVKLHNLESLRDNVILVHLTGSVTVLEKRLASRKEHFMPSSLLQSQLETLVPPDQDEKSITVDVDNTVENIIDIIIGKLG